MSTTAISPEPANPMGFPDSTVLLTQKLVRARPRFDGGIVAKALKVHSISGSQLRSDGTVYSKQVYCCNG
jgi:hypothetical protein